MEELTANWIRVSTILAMIPTFSEGKWCYPIQSIDPGVLQRKADLGTSVHSAINAHVKGEFFPITEKEEGYLESYLKWERELRFSPIFTETRYYDQTLRLTGCVDMIAKFSNGKLYILDFKCTVSPDPVKWPLQAAFYQHLATKNEVEIETTCLFVQLDKEGAFPKVYKYDVDYDLFSHAMTWYNAYSYLTNKCTSFYNHK